MVDDRDKLTDQERRQLRQFVRLVYDIHESRFIRSLPEIDHTISAKRLANGEFEVTVPAYDLEDFRSFLTAFRQVAISEGELTYLPRIRNIVSQHSRDELRAELQELKRHIFPIMKGQQSESTFSTIAGDRRVALDAGQLLNAIVNGRVFHGNLEITEIAEVLLAKEPGVYVGMVLSEIIAPVVSACVWLVTAIHREKILDDADFPNALLEKLRSPSESPEIGCNSPSAFRTS